MIRRLLTGLVFMLFVGTASAQYRVDRLITAGRSALYYEDYVLSIKYFNLAIGANTPPLGIDLMAACRTAGIPMSASFRYLLPFIGVMALVMFLLVLFPQAITSVIGAS